MPGIFFHQPSSKSVQHAECQHRSAHAVNLPVFTMLRFGRTHFPSAARGLFCVASAVIELTVDEPSWDFQRGKSNMKEVAIA